MPGFVASTIWTQYVDVEDAEDVEFIIDALKWSFGNIYDLLDTIDIASNISLPLLIVFKNETID